MAETRPADAIPTAAPPSAPDLSAVLPPAEAERLTDALARILLAALRVRALRALGEPDGATGHADADADVERVNAATG